MMNWKSPYFYASLFYALGFLVMLLTGIYGKFYFFSGVIFFMVGSRFSFFIKKSYELKKLGVVTIILFLVNLVWYSSVEVLAFLDVSFAIYVLLIGNLGLLALLNYRLDRWPPHFPYLKWVLFFLVGIAFSSISAQHSKEVIYFLVINLGALTLFYAAIALFKNSGSLLLIIVKWITGLGIVSSALAVWQLYSDSFKNFFFPYIAQRDEKILELWEVVSRVVGTWQHPSYLGIYLAIAIPLAVYLMFYGTEKLAVKFFWGAGIVLMSGSLLLTNTRSSVLAGFFGVALIYVFANFSKAEFLRRFPNVKKIATLGILAALGILLYQFVFVTEIYTKPQAYRVDASATIWGRFIRADSMSTESLVQRSQLYSLAFEKFKESPVLGIGAKNFSYEVEGLFERGTDTHNLILQTMAETGIVGLVSVLLLYGVLLREVYRQLKTTEGLSKKYLESAFFAAFLLILFDSMFNNPLYSLRIVAIFWLLVALSQINHENIKIGAKN